MSKVFSMTGDGKTRELKRARCRDEILELQNALAATHDLLPGEQIDPDDPRRWLLIRREMPIPDPNTGTDRWSLDFVFVDQSAVLTLVECKRYADTRSRREVVGQIIEYAANGQYYWTADFLLECAQKTAEDCRSTLSDKIRALHPDDDLGDDVERALFERAMANLKEGMVRIVFFLEEAPRELKCIADFLNRQLKRAEVLIVEAKQYEQGGDRIIVPTLFGFTEEARLAKETVKVIAPNTAVRQTWTKERFFERAEQDITPGQLSAIRRFHEFMLNSGASIDCGTGRKGSINPRFRDLCQRSVVSIYTNGMLQVNFGHLNGTPEAESLRDVLLQLLRQKRILPLKDDARITSKYPLFPPEEWIGKVDELVSAIAAAVAEARHTTSRGSS